MASRKRQLVPTVYLAVAGLAAVAVFPTALRPPPDEATTSAEFSPDAPPEDQPEAIIQSLQQGASRTPGASGEAIAAAEQAAAPDAPTTTTTAPPTPAAVRNRCYGDPPRQLESVYSPSCQPAFVGDNGGATATGVTATEIRIGFAPDLSGQMTGPECGEIGTAAIPGESDAHRTYRLLQEWFNQNLELYGRRLRFYFACASGQGEAADRAKVVKLRQEYDVFGAIGEFSGVVATEAARNGIAYMANIVTSGDTFYRNLQPYVWGSRAHSTRAVEMSAEYLCRRLHGNPPFPTGDPTIDAGSPRTYGILALDEPTTAESVQAMQDRMLARCGAQAEVVARYNLDDNVQGITTAMTQLSAARVSTVIFMGEILTLPVHTQIADQQSYFPEWYLMGAGGFETSITLARSISPRQWAHAFGFSFEEIPRRPRSTPCYRAYRSLDPENDPNNSVCEIMFHSMLFMFGAMQEAGPNLTVESWSAALQRAFTRPATPEWSMSGGFSPTDFTYGDYAVELYWDPAAIHPDGSPGAYVYLNGGQRFLSDGIPTGQPAMFQGGITDGDNAGSDGNSFN